MNLRFSEPLLNPLGPDMLLGNRLSSLSQRCCSYVGRTFGHGFLGMSLVPGD